MHITAVQVPGPLVDLKTVLSLGIPALVTVVALFFGHLLNSRREHANRKREARVRALEKAFLRLAYASNRELTDNTREELETFVAELQLYGNPTHVELMTKMVDQFVHPPPSKRVDFDQLLEALRDSLREELGLEPIRGKVWWLRIGKPQSATIPPSAKETSPASASAIPPAASESGP